jgi:hypothetical protein
VPEAVQVASFGTQAIPTLEQATSPFGARRQVRQPSDHSLQVADGGASGLEPAGAGTGSDCGAGAEGRSAATAGNVEHTAAARTAATIS